MENKERKLVDNVEALENEIARVREAQAKYATYTQEQVDAIFKAAAIAANMARIPLAKMAVEETGMGVVEDKVIKNNYAAEYIYNKYKSTKTCGVIEEDSAFGIKKVAEPIGVIAAVIPTTNPTSTAIFKTLISLKTRNGIIISPHPRAKKSTIAAAKLVDADGFIRMLPNGYQTMLSGDGSGLSQGQRQLLSIARAAVADPPVMILDEATSSIDTRTEAIVQRGMDNLMKGRTVFVIAHRLSTVQNADVIMVLDHGHIKEKGSHEKLIAQKGQYYRLYTGAFELE